MVNIYIVNKSVHKYPIYMLNSNRKNCYITNQMSNGQNYILRIYSKLHK